jgi:hypothetical protein
MKEIFLLILLKFIYINSCGAFSKTETLPIANVKAFGAIGDGITDDTESVQKAVNSIKKGTVYFPKGIYRIAGKQKSLNEQSRLSDGIIIKGNITYSGKDAVLKADQNCCFIFKTQLRKAITNAINNPHNIVIKGLTFEKESAIWFEQSELLNIESCTNLTIENCKFKGWSGDAITFGFNMPTTLDKWYQSIIQNVKLIHCDFDGVSKNNRQAISFMCGQNVLISHCNFIRTTRPNMPGAIDVEPEYKWCLINNIVVNNCTFDDIGGDVAVVSFVLDIDLNKAPGNIGVKNCVFKNITNPVNYAVYGKKSTDNLNMANDSPHSITFSGNLHKIGNNRMFWIYGCKNIIITNEKVEGLQNQAVIGKENYPVEDFSFTKNNINNYIIEGTIYDAPFNLIGNITTGSISGNTFVNCGNKSKNILANYLTFGFAGRSGLQTKNIIIADNQFINSTSFNKLSYGLHCSGKLVNSNTIVLKHNLFKNLSPYNHPYSLYAQCKKI